MPAKDIIHDAVRNALENDGWTITDDPLTLTYKDKSVYTDLGAERLIGAQREQEKIAVEVKSFIGASVIRDVEIALGQHALYLAFLSETEKDRKLYIALTTLAYAKLSQSDAIQMLFRYNEVSLIVVDVDSEVVISWIQN